MTGIVIVLSIFLIILIIFIGYRNLYISNVKLDTQLETLLSEGLVKKKKVKIKVYEPDTIIAASISSTIYRFQEGIFIQFKKAEDGFMPVWLYFSEDAKDKFPNCKSTGKIDLEKSNDGIIEIEASVTTNFIPFSFSKMKMKYVIKE